MNNFPSYNCSGENKSILLRYFKAWSGDLPLDRFEALLASDFVYYSQGVEIHGASGYWEYLERIRATAPGLALVPEIVFCEEDFLVVYFRWHADLWHRDIVGGKKYSNFCKMVLRIHNRKISAKWEQAQDFIFLSGTSALPVRFSYPRVLTKSIYEKIGDIVVASDDSKTHAMSGLVKKVIDCAFGHRPLNSIEKFVAKDVKFINGNRTGKGISEWKTFAFAIRTAFRTHPPQRFDELVVREGNSVSIYLRIGIKEESPYLLAGFDGMVAAMRLEIIDFKVQKIETYEENYLFFLGTCFEEHEFRVANLFKGRRDPLASSLPQALQQERVSGSGESCEEVAVVGIAGRFPKADNIEDFWSKLETKDSFVSTLPRDRPGLANSTNTKYASVIADVFSFDAEYFQIPPVAVEYMDPQQRLLLETIVQSIDDSGYSNNDFSGSKTAVFTTSLSSDYEKLLRDAGVEQNFYYWAGNEPSMFSAKIARFLDIQGPTKNVFAECTGGSTALHEACQLIKSGEVEQAIVGGTSLFLHPYGFSVREEGLLTEEAFSKVFSADSRGQIRSEAVVSVVLKSLSKAIADHDHIYGVIAGSAVNNSGKTFSLIASNVEKQAAAIQSALSNSGLTPDCVSAVECNASGVREGDYSEVSALKKVFSSADDIYLSTVKSAIGHAEAASGLVSLVKVLQQFKHEKILAIQGLEDVDSGLAIEETNLVPVVEHIAWQSDRPRVAGINSFAGGGYNTHLVVREYVDEQVHYHSFDQDHTPLLFMLSAQSQHGLADYCKKLHDYLIGHPQTNLRDFSYSLYCRQARDYRLSIVADSVEQLVEALARFASFREFASSAERSINENPEQICLSPPDQQHTPSSLQAIGESWCCGQEIDWPSDALSPPAKRVGGIPARGFFGDHYFPPKGVKSAENPGGLFVERFMFSGDEIFISQHCVDGRHLLPGVVQLELAREAAYRASVAGENLGESQAEQVFPFVTKITNLAWSSVVVYDHQSTGSLDIEVRLTPKTVSQNSRSFSFEVADTNNVELSSAGVSCFGEVQTMGGVEQPILDTALFNQQQCSRLLDAESSYNVLGLMGIEIGDDYRTIQSIGIQSEDNQQTQVIAKLESRFANQHAVEQEGSGVAYILPPSIVDASLQASFIGLISFEHLQSLDRVPVPFSVDEINIYSAVPAAVWVLIRQSASDEKNQNVLKIDIDLCDEMGRVCVAFRKFSVRFSSPDDRLNRSLVRGDSQLSSSGSQGDFEAIDQSVQVQELLKRLIAEEFKIPVHRLKISEPFDRYGIDSSLSLKLTARLEADFGSLPKTLFYEYKDIRSLAEYLAAHRPPVGASTNTVVTKAVQAPPVSKDAECTDNIRVVKKDSTGLGIAVVGMSGRFPQCENVEQLWQALVGEKNCVSLVPEDRWNWKQYYSERFTTTGDKNSAHAGKWGGFLDGIDLFDAAFFNISAKEAASMDPQERLFLQETWKAVEDAGYTPEGLTDEKRLVGVYVGAMYQDYQLFGVDGSTQVNTVGLAGSLSSVSDRVSYFMDFRGPSLTIDTMCSSSLAAFDIACRDLRSGRTNAGIVGGVNLSLHPNKYSVLTKRAMLSSHNRVESFGSGADGYVPAEAVCAVVLKRLEDAERDGDHIYGVIQGSSVSHSGRSNGFSTPDIDAQKYVVQDAMREAGVQPQEVGYIEAHGTGTTIGDAIEIRALEKAFNHVSKEKSACLLGSVKSNLGHCESAAGIVGVIKVLLQLQHKKIVASIHAEQTNENIHFEQVPFSLCTSLREWVPSSRGKKTNRIAGVSCFGAGGSNGHILLGEYARAADSRTFSDDREQRSQYLIPLSANVCRQRTSQHQCVCPGRLCLHLAGWARSHASESRAVGRISGGLASKVGECSGGEVVGRLRQPSSRCCILLRGRCRLVRTDCSVGSKQRI